VVWHPVPVESTPDSDVRPGQHRMLALDLGAETGRAIVGVFDGERLRVQEIHRFANEPVRLGSNLVWDFPRLFHEVLVGIGRAAAGRQLDSVGVDAWGVDFGLLDADDRMIGLPIHYRDRRTEGAISAVDALVSRADLFAQTGTQVLPVNTLYQLVAMVRSRDPSLREARTLLMIPDLVLRFLSGSVVTELTNATTTQCFDISRLDWSRELLARLEVPDRILPPVVPPGTVLGSLLPSVADETGGSRTMVVAPATHDTASAVAAIPLDRPATTVWISSGTWSLVGLEVDRPFLNEPALHANLTNEGGLGGRILLQKSVTGLWLVQECRRALVRAGMDVDHRTLERLARLAPGGTAFVDPDDERFFRPGALPQAVRSYCRDTGQPEPSDAGTMVRVLLESLALKYAWSIRLLERVTGQTIERIHIVGGGAQNELLCQLTADASGLPVMAGPIEAAAIGNLLSQATAAGRIATLDEAREVVRRSFSVRSFEPIEDWIEVRERFARVATRAIGLSSTIRPDLPADRANSGGPRAENH
jgi:rhamnulokinase